MKSEISRLAEFAVDNGVFGVFDSPITLKSGKKSNIYINWRVVVEDMFLVDRLSDYLAEKISEYDVDTVIGVAEGATKIGLFTQYKLAKKSKAYDKGTHTLSMIRGKTKKHGSIHDKNFLGIPKGKVALIEDVTTTGGSLMDAIQIIKEIDGVEISTIFVLTNRDDRVKEMVEEVYGIDFVSLSSASDLAKYYLEKNPMNSKLKKIIDEEF